MPSTLPAIETNKIVNRLLLKRTFDFETETSIQDCAKKLGWLHSEAQTGDFIGVRSRLSAKVTPLSPDRYAFTVQRLNTTRSYDSRIQNTSSVFTTQGTLTSHPETGGTRVTRESRLSSRLVAGLGIAVIYLLFLIVRGQASPVLGLAVLAMFGALAYTGIRDRNNLLQELRSL
jgi:hypothetical protein